MKFYKMRLLYISAIFILCLNIALGYMHYTNVRTFKGSNVNHKRTDVACNVSTFIDRDYDRVEELLYDMELIDYSDEKRNELAEDAYTFGAIEIVSEATITYNCHGYAWAYEQENCWINTPNNDVFWEDGSFIEVTDNTYY